MSNIEHAVLQLENRKKKKIQLRTVNEADI